jgi:polysaccharide deacetylase family protein (PEP-CTERM system associated)
MGVIRATNRTSVNNVFSVDVEDYFQVTGFENSVSRSSWKQRESRVCENTTRLLGLLERHQTSATFFVLGWVAEHLPHLVESIAKAGHEVGSHGYWHHSVSQQSKQQFRDDVRRSKSVLESIINQEVTAYRAPTFSITRKTFWALDVLIEEGYLVDSSVFPSAHTRNGVAAFPREIQTIKKRCGSIVEFPMPVASCFGKSIPAGGGGYFRLYPYPLTRKFIRQINQSGRPFMFYIHPWEVDPDQPKISGPKWSARFRHYVNLHSTFHKLDRLLNDFQFTTMNRCLNEVLRGEEQCQLN